MKECLKCKEMLNNDRFFSDRTIYKRKRENLPDDICKNCYADKNRRHIDFNPTSEIAILSRIFLANNTTPPTRWDMTLC